MSKYIPQSGIYVIVHIKSSKIYIGQTNDFRKRWRGHKSALLRGEHGNHHLQSAWNKYGEKAFKFQILEHCSIEQLDEREQYWLDIYIPKGICYNFATDVVAPMRGHPFTEEHRQKISIALKGKPRSEEHCRKLSLANKQRSPMSDETRNKMSESKKGKRPNNAGRKVSKETLQKMSEATKGENNPFFGNTHTEITRLKMKEAWVRRRAGNQSGDSSSE